jgi:hypothetical protein
MAKPYFCLSQQTSNWGLGDRRQETGDRRQETGDRRQETELNDQGVSGNV